MCFIVTVLNSLALNHNTCYSKTVADQLSLIPPVAVPLPKQVSRPMSHKDLVPSLKPPPEFTFITWNIDGLNQHNLKKRTKAVCMIIFE